MMRALALTLMLVPSLALAQTAPPSPTPAPEGECTVTTTVKCTGAAAPYAIEAAKPQPPVIVQPPPPAPPPVAAPPPVFMLDPHQLSDGWRIVQSTDGCLYRERKVSTDSPAVWGTGMAFWLGGYAGAIIGGMEQGDAGMFGWWPVVGAFVNTAFTSGTGQALWVIDGLAQTGGFVTFLVGLAAGPDKLERLPLTVAPTAFVGGGSGVALTGRF